MQVIRTFRDPHTEQLWRVGKHKKVDPRVLRAATRKLQMLDAADDLYDLRVPPSNHLELLSGDRAGQYSIRINLQWRLCFEWTDKGPENVEFCDYH